MCCSLCCEGRGQVSSQSRAQKPARNNSGWGQEGWSEILHASNATMNLTEVPSCLCCLGEHFLAKALKRDILCVTFAKPSVLRKSQLFSHALLVCAHFLCGQVPQESSTTLSTLFLCLMSVQEHWFHKRGWSMRHWLWNSLEEAFLFP